MRFQALKRTGNEKVFATYKNGEAYQLTEGTAVCLDLTKDPTGEAVYVPQDGKLEGFIGAVAEGVTLGTSGNHDCFGEIQVYGYHGALRLTHPDDTAGAIAPGNVLTPAAGTSNFYKGVSNVAGRFAIAGTTVAVGTTYSSTIPGWIRAL